MQIQNDKMYDLARKFIQDRISAQWMSVELKQKLIDSYESLSKNNAEEVLFHIQGAYATELTKYQKASSLKSMNSFFHYFMMSFGIALLACAIKTYLCNSKKSNSYEFFNLSFKLGIAASTITLIGTLACGMSAIGMDF